MTRKDECECPPEGHAPGCENGRFARWFELEKEKRRKPPRKKDKAARRSKERAWDTA